jgi:hypothetical protein
MVQQDSRHYANAQADSDGNFEVKGLPEGEVSVQVWTGNAYEHIVVKATAGDRNVRIVLKKRAVKPKSSK